MAAVAHREPVSCYRWFDSPGMHVEVPLGGILNPKLLLMCLLAPLLAATVMYECQYELLQVALDKKHLLNALNVNVNTPLKVCA